MEITALVAIFTAILALGWRLTHKMDKTAADLRGEMRSNHTELTNRLDKQADRIETVRTELTGRIDRTETRLSGEIQTVRTELTDTRTELTGRIETVRTELTDTRTELTGRIETVRTELTDRIETVRTELTGRIDKSEARLGGEIREVGNKVELLEKRVGHYEQRISYAEGELNLGFGASPADDPTAHPIGA